MSRTMHSDAADSKRNSGSHPESNDFAADYNELKKTLHKLQGDVTHIMETTMHAGKTGVSALKDQASDMVGGIKDKASGKLESIGDTISEHPLASAAIALGAGYILAKILGRR